MVLVMHQMMSLGLVWTDGGSVLHPDCKDVRRYFTDGVSGVSGPFSVYDRIRL